MLGRLTGTVSGWDDVWRSLLSFGFHSGNAHKGLLEVAGLQDPESSARDDCQLLQFWSVQQINRCHAGRRPIGRRSAAVCCVL